MPTVTLRLFSMRHAPPTQSSAQGASIWRPPCGRWVRQPRRTRRWRPSTPWAGIRTTDPAFAAVMREVNPFEDRTVVENLIRVWQAAAAVDRGGRMTREECIATLKTLNILDAQAAHACAEAVLLEWLLSRGKATSCKRIWTRWRRERGNPNMQGTLAPALIMRHRGTEG